MLYACVSSIDLNSTGNTVVRAGGSLRDPKEVKTQLEEAGVGKPEFISDGPVGLSCDYIVPTGIGPRQKW